MKLGIFSDLHLEFRWRQGFTWQNVADKINVCVADLVINAGDTHPLPETRKAFRNLITLPYEEILGNHDFYQMQKLYPSRFVAYHDVKIAGCTLWTDFDKGDPLTLLKFKNTLADGHQIVPNDPNRQIADEIYDQFRSDLDFLDTEDPDVVITHHAPSKKSVHPKFLNSGFVNHYFMSELDDFILQHPKIKLWVHGHMHSPVDYMIGNCRVLANPLGYPGETYKSVEYYQVAMIEV